MEDPYRIHTEAPGSFQSSDVLTLKHVMSTTEPVSDDLTVAFGDVSRWLFVAGVVVTTAVIIGKNLALPAFFVWAILMGAIAVIDFEQLRIPNRLVGLAAVVMYPLLALASFSSIAGTSLWRAVAGSFALLLGYLALHLIAPRSLGMGDVKLAFVIGGHLAFFGWGAVYDGTLVAFGSMAVVGLGLILFKRAGRRTGVPFGPFMIFGALVAIAMAV